MTTVLRKSKRPGFPGGCARGDGLSGDAGPLTASSRVALSRAAPICPTLVPSLGLLSGLVKAMVQHVLGVRRCPAVRQQAVQGLPARVHRLLQDDVVQVGPGLHPVPLRPALIVQITSARGPVCCRTVGRQSARQQRWPRVARLTEPPDGGTLPVEVDCRCPVVGRSRGR